MTDTNNQLISQLETLGLHKTEAKLYIAGISFSESVSVTELKHKTGLKRPTIYHNLGLLQQRGIVAVVVSQRGNRYIFSEPTELERSIHDEVRQAKSKLRTLSLLMDELESLRPAESNSAISVRHFQGEQGVKTIVDMALFCKKPEWKIIAPLNNFFREFDPAYARYYTATRKRHGIVSKTLWEKPDPAGMPLNAKELVNRQPRYLPETMIDTFSSTVILFDNKIAIIASVKEQSAVLLESEEFYKLFSALFDGLWNISVPYQDTHPS